MDLRIASARYPNGSLPQYRTTVGTFWVSEGDSPIPSLAQVSEKISSHSVGYLFTLMIVSFVVQELFHLIRSHLSILTFVANAFGVLVMRFLPMTMY